MLFVLINLMFQTKILFLILKQSYNIIIKIIVFYLVKIEQHLPEISNRTYLPVSLLDVYCLK